MMLYSFCFLLGIIYPLCVECTLGVHNMSYKKPTRSSGSSGDYHSSNAVDGSQDTMFHSNSETSSWWMVDLRTVGHIHQIDVTNRKDCCQERIVGAVLQIMDDIGNVVEEKVFENASESYSWQVRDTEARFVRISLEGSFLHFTNMIIYGEDVTSGLDDLATDNGLVSSSGFISGFEDSNAVDGSDKTFFHSNLSTNAWWEIDFGAVVEIRQITILNRLDCCFDRIISGTVSILDIEGNVVESRIIESIFTDMITLSFPSDPRGLSVRIELADDFLNFREVEVYGEIIRDVVRHVSITDSAAVSSDGVTNLALHKPAKQAPNTDIWPASNAVDGEESTFSHTNINQLHSPTSWWEVDLERMAHIQELSILNRVDCCEHRLDNAWISVLDNNKDVVFREQVVEGSPEIVRFKTDIDGQYVKVEITDEFLHLAEVQVLGTYLPSSMRRRHPKLEETDNSIHNYDGNAIKLLSTISGNNPVEYASIM